MESRSGARAPGAVDPHGGDAEHPDLYPKSFSVSISRRVASAIGVARDRDFALLWAAESVSQVGTQFTVVVLPLLAAVTLNASPFAIGLLAAAGGLPHLLFGLFAGAWIDRMRRRPVMIVADVGRCVLLLTIPAAAWAGALTIPLLIGVAFLVETLTVFFDLAYLSYVPSLVPHDRLVEANSRLEASASASQVIGPAIGGAVVRLVGAPLAMAVDAISYLLSAAFLVRVRAREAEPVRAAEADITREIREGLATLWRNPVLRGLALASATVNLGGFIFLAVYVLYLVRVLHLDAGAVGLVFAMGGIGALAGSVAATPARGRWGARRTLVGSLFLFGVFGLTVPLAVLFPRYALPMILASELLQWFALVIYSINAVSVRQAITPGHLLGRVSGSVQFLSYGARTVASLLGGLLGSRIGLPATLVIGAMLMLLSFVPLLGKAFGEIEYVDLG